MWPRLKAVVAVSEADEPRSGGRFFRRSAAENISSFNTSLERQASDNLSRARLRARAINPTDKSVAAGQTLLSVFRRGRSGIGAGQYSTSAAAQLHGLWAGQKEAVEHVVEFRPDLEPDVTLSVHEKVTAKTHRFRRLPLPAVVVQIRRRRSELSWRRIDPCILI